MDAIDSFLDAMFAPYSSTARLAEAKAELRTMMEDAYHDAVASGRTHNEAVGAVITDFGNLEELAPVLGISADLGGDGAAARPDAPAPNQAHPSVTLPQARALARARWGTASTLGHAVSCFVLAPAMLLALTDLASAQRIAIDESTATFIGLAFALVLVAIGVLMLVQRRAAFTGVQHLVEGRFTRDPIVSAWAARERQSHEQERSRKLGRAVVLWIMAALPPLATSLLVSSPAQSEGLTGAAVAVSLLLVAGGLQIYLPATWAASTCTTLTSQGRPAAGHPAAPAQDDDEEDALVGVVASVYWPVCVAAYLLWSFAWDAWDRSWILWPVAGLLFGAFAAARSVLRKRR